MKHIIILSVASALSAITLSAAEHTVISSADSGPGTLRQLVADAADGDRVLIPAGMNIVLDSGIVVSDGKRLFIEGHGLPSQSVITSADTASIAIYFEYANGGVANVTFAACTNLVGYGAALGSMWWVDDFVVSNCVFKSNYSQNGGGALVLDGGGLGDPSGRTHVWIVDCVFEDNRAYQEGGAAAYVTVGTEFINCVFHDNGALNPHDDAKGGGAVRTSNWRGAFLRFKGCEFTGNTTAGGHGGAILAERPLFIEDCVFDGNDSGTGKGGAVALIQDSHAAYPWGHDPFVRRSVFTGNSGGSGGAVFLSMILDIEVGDCVFENSTGVPVWGWESGGAVFANSTVAAFKRCVFRGNRAEGPNGKGGAFGSGDYQSPVFFTDCLFENNFAQQDSAALRLRGRTLLENCTFTGNTTSNDVVSVRVANVPEQAVEMVNCTFAGNTVERGGIISQYQPDEIVVMANCTVTGNTADSAVWYEWGQSVPFILAMTNCVVAHNSGLDINQNIINMSHCVFSQAQSAAHDPYSGAPRTAIKWDATTMQTKFDDFAGNGIRWTFADGSVLPTIAFSTGSILRNRGTQDIPEWMTTDARGFPRKDAVSGVPDIGAYEFSPPWNTVMIVK